MMQRTQPLSILFKLALLGLVGLLTACAAAPAPVIVRTLEPVPYPPRPAFVQLHNGDLAPLSVPARERLAQQHVQIVWYLKNLEEALKVYDAQVQRASTPAQGED